MYRTSLKFYETEARQPWLTQINALVVGYIKHGMSTYGRHCKSLFTEVYIHQSLLFECPTHYMCVNDVTKFPGPKNVTQ